MIAVEESKYIYELGGPDMRNKVGGLPCSQNIADKDVYLELTELGNRLGFSPAAMNNKLAELGLQRKDGKDWVTTDKGSLISNRHCWNIYGKSGYNYKWKVEVVKQLI